LYNWLIVKELRDYHPTRKTINLKYKKEKLTFLTPKDIEKSINALESYNFFNLRDKAIIGLMWYCTLTRIDCADAKLSELELTNRRLLINRYDNNVISVQLNEIVTGYLQNWLKIRGQVESPFIFMTNIDGKISARTMTRIVQEVGKKTDLRINLKLIRDSAIEFYKSKGLKLINIQYCTKSNNVGLTEAIDP